MLLGGDLLKDCYDDEVDPGIIFTIPDQDILEGWLKKVNWFDKDIVESLMKVYFFFAHPYVFQAVNILG
jgi:hypothetical protein